MKHICLIFFWLIIINITSQSYKQLVDYADLNAKKGDYYGASIYYKKAMNIDSSKIEVLYKYANSLRHYNNYNKAEYYYNKVLEKDKTGKIYKDAIFWLAEMKKYNAKYREASKIWRKVKSKYSRNKKSFEYLKAKQEILSCNYANRIKNDSLKNAFVENIGKKINTTDSEFGANLVGENLYFSSLRTDKKLENLEIYDSIYKIKQYKSKLTDTTIEHSKLIKDKINNTKFHNANSSYDTENKTIYYTQCDSLNKCKIVYSKLQNNKWTTPKELPERINAKETITTQPNFCKINAEKYLFFVSNRKGGYGNLDIWYSKILDGNTFSKPQNAGKNINTIGDEITPFYDTVEKALFFSSNWHLGKGGFDVFKSKGTPEKLQKPQNMLSPINTQWNDMYFTIYPEKNNERIGYLTSNRLGSYFVKGATCCNDIYKVNILNDKKIADKQKIENLEDLNKYLPVTLYFHNDRPGPRSLDTTVNINYIKTYQYYTSLHQKYIVEYTKGLKEEQKLEAELDIENLFKHYINKGVSDLKLFTELLLEELKKGQKIEITIRGFASPLAKTEYNVNLTKRRISSLINYLKEYNNGEFIPYLNNTSNNGGAIYFEKIPFGEYTANTNVSDNYLDQRNSIYSKGAALERKIEIQSVTFADRGKNYAELTVDNGTYDFGKVKQGQILEYNFTIKNTGNIPLEIVGTESECKCVEVKLDKDVILPNKQAILTMKLNTKQLEGKVVKSATIFANSFPKIKRIVFTAEVLNY